VSSEASSLRVPPPRRLDLDLLRIGAFGLLILYHVGLMFSPWDFTTARRPESVHPLLQEPRDRGRSASTGGFRWKAEPGLTPAPNFVKGARSGSLGQAPLTRDMLGRQ